MVHTGIEPTASALLAPWAHQLSFANYTQSPSCLPVFGNAFQEGLLHHLSRDRGEADWLVVPWIFFFALLEDRSDICFLPAVKMSLHNHALSKKITSGFKVMLPSSFTTHGCFISGLCLKWPLCQSAPLKVYIPCSQASLWSQRPTVPAGCCSVSFITGVLAPFGRGSMFSLVFLLLQTHL